jgi:hypothetical protein
MGPRKKTTSMDKAIRLATLRFAHRNIPSKRHTRKRLPPGVKKGISAQKISELQFVVARKTSLCRESGFITTQGRKNALSTLKDIHLGSRIDRREKVIQQVRRRISLKSGRYGA